MLCVYPREKEVEGNASDSLKKEGDEGDVLYWMLINGARYHPLLSLHHLFHLLFRTSAESKQDLVEPR